MKIRLKLTVLPIVAILMPLLGGILYVRYSARNYYEEQVGVLYLTIAKEIKDALDRDVVGQMHALEGWITLFDLSEKLEEVDMPPVDPETIAQMESIWPALGASEEPLYSILHNPMAEILNHCRQINPLFVELMLTDREGRLVAATNPTTDYWQGDEDWWLAAMGAKSDQSIWTHTIMYDSSAGVQTMDITIPIRDDAGEVLGVVKGSLNAIEVLRRLAPDPWNAEISRDILFDDGRLFARLNAGSDDVRLPDHIAPEAFSRLVAAGDVCQKVQLFPGKSSLAVSVPVGMQPMLDGAGSGYPTIHVLVHREYVNAMAPVDRVIRELTWQGSVVVLLIAILGFILSSVWFARPLQRLQHAAHLMGEHVRRQEQGAGGNIQRSLQEVQHSLDRLSSIRTRDEMQELAEVFAHMSRRVLNFHHRLEQELHRAMEEINEDLIMAREFQEALLPSRYPEVSCADGGDAYNLSFSHIYRPAQSVSGDFFDITEVAKHCVRVVVADVMGHGARSALMTAILHALISDTAKEEDRPEALLQRMNDMFRSIGKRTGDMVFVTAVHMLIDTQERRVRYAMAGHPSPLVIDRVTGTVDALAPETRIAPAAGLFSDTKYKSAEYSIEKDHTLLLYTDGVVEAQNEHSEEFGTERLLQALRQYAAGESSGSLPESVYECLETFMGSALAMDDICLLSVDITAPVKK